MRKVEATPISKIVLFSGPIAAGKTSLRNYLVNHFGFRVIKTSEYLVKIAASCGISPNRKNLQDLGDRLDNDTNYKWIIEDVAIPIISLEPGKNWIVDAVRKKEQVALYKSLIEASVIHAHITAPEAILLQRYNSRMAMDGSSEAASYEAATNHENERNARSLDSIADLIVNMHELSIIAASQLIVEKAGITLDHTR